MPGDLTRRTFLERAALVTAAATLGRGVLAAQAPSGMFVSLPPWAVARNVGWPDQARLAAKVGYKGIDWAFGPARQAGVDATKALLSELGIVPTIVNLPMQNALGGAEDAFQAQLPKLDADAAFSRAVGCRNFQLVLGATAPAGQTKEQRWTIVRDRLAAIGKVLAKHDMRLGLEFLGPMVFRTGRGGGAGRRGGAAPNPGAPPAPPPAPPATFVYTLNETVKLAAEAGPNIGATLDAWHWHHSGGTVADIRATDPARIIHVHVSDAKAMPPEEVQDNMRWFPGEGIIDLVGFFQALRAINWQGGVAPEVIGPRVPDDMAPEESARLALEATTAVMKRAQAL